MSVLLQKRGNFWLFKKKKKKILDCIKKRNKENLFGEVTKLTNTGFFSLLVIY